jgi:hypothetical protein
MLCSSEYWTMEEVKKLSNSEYFTPSSETFRIYKTDSVCCLVLRVPRDSDPRMTALARTGNSCKRQTRPLVRKSDPHQQTHNCLTVIKIWSQGPDGRFIPRQTGRLAVSRNIRQRLRLRCRCLYPARELKLELLGKKVLRHIGNFARCTPARDLLAAFNLPHVYGYITKLCRQQAEVIQNHENEHGRGIGQGEARHRKYKRLNLCGGEAYGRSVE